VIVVARGGGSVADLLCFSDETLCRTVALNPVPVIASVGHHTDRTLLDDVAAVSCSTPTHAAEAAVAIDCNAARAANRDAGQRVRAHAERALSAQARQAQAAQRLSDHGRSAVLTRARLLASLSRAPAAHVESQRVRLHQHLREIRAGSRRRIAEQRSLAARRALVLERKADSTLLDCRSRRPRELEQLRRVLDGHDPQRTLERGYALVRSASGEPLTSAAAAARERELQLRFADGELAAQVKP
jgi:exodeoxyribonuclease VII large subunit